MGMSAHRSPAMGLGIQVHLHTGSRTTSRTDTYKGVGKEYTHTNLKLSKSDKLSVQSRSSDNA